MLLVAVALVAGCTGREVTVPPVATSPAADAIAVLEVPEFADLLDDPDVTVVNVHVPYAGELPGTDGFVAYDRMLEWDGLPQDRDAPLALYCMSGTMSQQAALMLIEAGYTDVRDLDGGMLAWRDSGRELVTQEPAPQPQG